MPSLSLNKKLLFIGASRGLGFALAEEYLNCGWDVVATERDAGTSRLHDIAKAYQGRLEIKTVDIVHADQVTVLRARLASRKFDMLFVNAEVTNKSGKEIIGRVPPDEFFRVRVTNALGPLRVIEALQDLVISDGTIGVMSSGRGSVSNNKTGQEELYRGHVYAQLRCPPRR